MTTYVWSGNLSFGLVSLPVHVLAAIKPRATALTMLHEKDAAPLERRMVCPEHDEVVDLDEQVRGFRISKGDYVVVTEDELASLAPERSQAIEIEKFVPVKDIEPLYFERPYYLVPESGADRPYWLLVQALEDTERAGIAKFVMKEREHLVAVMALERVLCLMTLHYYRQRVSPEGLIPERTRVSHDRRDALVDFINKHTRHFDPEIYKDENDLRLLELVKDQAREEGIEKSSRSRRTTTLSKKRASKKINRAIRKVKPASKK